MSVDLAYVDYGTEHGGLPVVLLHAFPVPGAMFTPVASRLAGERRVVVPDLRGFGDSPHPGDEPPSLDLMADDVVALLDRLNIDRAALGGVSMGGYIVMAMLRRRPDRVANVTLMDTKASEDDDGARDNRERIAQAVLDTGSRVLRPMLETLLGPTTHRSRPAVVKQVSSWLDQARPPGVAWAQRAMAARPASFSTLSGTGVRGAVVIGDEDGVTTHDDALAMSAAFHPPAPVHVIAGAGHLSPVENPDAAAGALRDALRRAG